MRTPPDFQVGQQYYLRGHHYQIVAIEEGEAQLRSIQGPPMIVYQTVNALQSAAGRGHLRKTQEAPITCSPDKIVAGLTLHQTAKFKVSMAYVTILLNSFSGVLSHEGFDALKDAVDEKIGPHRHPGYSTVCTWRRAFLEQGGFIALIPSRRLHCKHLSHQPEEIRELIRDNVKEFFWIDNPWEIINLSKAIQLAIKDRNRGRSALNQYRIPSLSTLRRIIKELDAYKTELAQNGKWAARRKNRFGGKLHEPERLFEVVQLDTQRMHVILVDGENRVVGRPYLTVFFEVTTRHVVGWHVSFNPPSSDTTLRVFIESIRSDNPYGGVAESYLADNGAENIGESHRDRLELLLTRTSYCQPLIPDEKAPNERLFETLSKGFVHYLSGTTRSNVAKRGDYDSEAHAVYTLDELREMFAEWLDIYHREWHTALDMSPNEAWAERIEHDLPPRRYSVDDLKRLFWRQVMVTPSSGRVTTEKLTWYGGAISELSGRYPHSKKLILYFDTCDVSKAWLCHPHFPKDLQPLEALDPDYQTDLTLSFHTEIQDRLMKNKRSGVYESVEEAKIQLLIKISRQNKAKERLKLQGFKEKNPKSDPVAVARKRSTGKPRKKSEMTHKKRDDTPGDFSVRGWGNE